MYRGEARSRTLKLSGIFDFFKDRLGPWNFLADSTRLDVSGSHTLTNASSVDIHVARELINSISAPFSA